MATTLTTDSTTVHAGMYAAEAKYLAAGGRAEPPSTCSRPSSRRTSSFIKPRHFPLRDVARSLVDDAFLPRDEHDLGVIRDDRAGKFAGGATAVVLTQVRALARVTGARARLPDPPDRQDRGHTDCRGSTFRRGHRGDRRMHAAVATLTRRFRPFGVAGSWIG